MNANTDTLVRFSSLENFTLYVDYDGDLCIKQPPFEVDDKTYNALMLSNGPRPALPMNIHEDRMTRPVRLQLPLFPMVYELDTIEVEDRKPR